MKTKLQRTARLVSIGIAMPALEIGNSFFPAPEGKLPWGNRGDDDSAFARAREMHDRGALHGRRFARWVGDDQDSISLGCDAAHRTLDAANFAIGDVDLLLCASFFPKRRDVGDAAAIVEELGLSCTFMNLEAACSGGACSPHSRFWSCAVGYV